MPPTAEPPLRVAILGYGLAGSVFHAPFIHSIDGLEVAAILTRDADRSAAARARYPGADIVADVDEVWTMADRLDVVVLATPNRTHVPLGLAAVDAGLHIVVEKPLAASVEEARALIGAAHRRDLVLTVYQNRRWDGDFLTLRRLIGQGELGQVHRMESRFERWRPVPKPGWRQAPAPE
ncbi:MAG TPA: Gfo/Idh/MocA family oxidoreductase, partial [Longimicrobiales bacterium]|nr:Gfo/Idh/MocA family oxidoreductase [Longimicrobiales bacterium]